ncbi:hypothetical protein [Niallia sp. Krafla_26]|uniref:hypothetical protein n=1 Tax=Niallia sp. Krafla_26 TaxID=3064703 RepID=UPI003D17F760
MNIQLEDQPVSNKDLHLFIKISDTVRIKKVQESNREIEPEDFYYLKDYQNKTGTITEIIENRSGTVSYKVTFSEILFGFFYRDDFDIVLD